MLLSSRTPSPAFAAGRAISALADLSEATDLLEAQPEVAAGLEAMLEEIRAAD